MNFGRLTEALLRRRRLVIALGALLAILAATRLPHVRFEHDPLEVFSVDGTEQRYLQEVTELYGTDVDLVVVLVRPRARTWRPADLERLRAWETAAQQLPLVVAVEGPATSAFPRLEDGVLVSEPLLPATGPVDTTAATRFWERLLGDPLWRKLFVGDHADWLAVTIRFDPERLAYDEIAPALAALDAHVARLEDRFEAVAAGIPIVEQAYVTTIQSEQRRFMPLVLGLLVLVLAYLFRSWRGAVGPLLSVALAVLFATATMVEAGVPFDVINFTIPTLLLVIGIADAIHYQERFLESRREGAAPRAAVVHAGAAIAAACLLTSLTTAVGFGSLATARVAIIQRFGLWAAYGIMVAYVVTMIVMPLWLGWRPPTPRRHRAEGHHDATAALLAALARVIRRYPGRILVLWGIVALGAVAAMTQLHQNARLLEELYDDDPIVVAYHRVEAAGFGMLPLTVDFRFTGEGTALDPLFLDRLAELEAWLARQPIVARTGSIDDLAGLAYRLVHDGAPGRFTDPAELQQAWWLLESGAAERLERWLTPDGRRTRLQILRYDHGLEALASFITDLEAELARLWPPDGPVQWHVTGESVTVSQAVRFIVGDLLSSLGTAFVLIALMMSLLFRSVRVGLLSMIPNLLPLAVAAGTMALLGYALRISSALIFSVALGIAVDDTIHFLARYRRERLAGRDPEAAITATLASTGRALIWTSVLLVVGFAILITSRFRGISEFGLLVGVTLSVALLADLTLLPALLLKVAPFRFRLRRRGAPEGDA